MARDYEIEFYVDGKGYCEIQDFLNLLDSSNQKSDTVLLKKIIPQFNLLEILGPKLNEPQSKALKGYKYPVMELRPMPELFFTLGGKGTSMLSCIITQRSRIKRIQGKWKKR